ncbi:MAG: UDP-2,3-diacylglucosamine diphosphatase [Candidatus Kapaibacterium sp.]|nr:MAG: UDP-2,3-diacylglucosamine diphosphatase [Candidatus Kapabacteria bacterium]
MIYFISDQHLGLDLPKNDDKHREHTLVEFLRTIKPHCERLFILGDLFDYWFEYGTVIPKQHIRTLAALSDFADSGIPVDYLIGNHDFGHRHFFEHELGIRIHAGDLALALHGKRFYLAHGDGKIPHDFTARIVRSLLRNPLSLRLWQWIHPDIGIRLAAWASRRSRMKARENEDNLHFRQERTALEHFALYQFQQGYDVVIMGHLHKECFMQARRGEIHSALAQSFSAISPHSCSLHDTSHVYCNLGTWLNAPFYAVFEPSGGVIQLSLFEQHQQPL